VTQESSSSLDFSDLGGTPVNTPTPGAADFSDLGGKFVGGGEEPSPTPPPSTPATNQAVSEAASPPAQPASGFGGWLNREIKQMEDWNKRNVPPYEMTNQEMIDAVAKAKKEHPFMYGAAESVAEAIPTTPGALAMTGIGFIPVTQSVQDISGAYQNIQKAAGGAPMSSFAGKPFNEFNTEDWGRFVGQMGLQAAMAIPIFRGLRPAIKAHIMEQAGIFNRANGPLPEFRPQTVWPEWANRGGPLPPPMTAPETVRPPPPVTSIKPPVTERDYVGGGEEHAATVESTGPVLEHEVRTSMGDEASLRGKPKGTPGAQEPEPVPASESVAPPTPQENALTGIAERLRELNKSVDEYHSNKQLAPPWLNKEIEKAKQELNAWRQVTPTNVANLNRIKELQQLLNNPPHGLDWKFQMSNPKVAKLYDDSMNELFALQDQKNELLRDEPAEVLVIGTGAGGSSAAKDLAYEGVHVRALEAKAYIGGASAQSQEIINAARQPTAQKGKDLWRDEFLAMRAGGVDIRTSTHVTGGPTFDPETKLWSVPTNKGVETAYSIIASPGNKPKIFSRFNFEKGGKTYTEYGGVSYGHADRMYREGAGGDIIVAGGGNDALQSVMKGVDNPNIKKITVLARSPLEKSGSANPEERLQWLALKKNPKVEIIAGEKIGEVDRVLRKPDGTVTGVKTQAGRTIPAKAIGVFLAKTPNTGWMPDSWKAPYKPKPHHELGVQEPAPKPSMIMSDAQHRVTAAPGPFYVIGDVKAPMPKVPESVLAKLTPEERALVEPHIRTEERTPRIKTAQGEGSDAAAIAKKHLENDMLAGNIPVSLWRKLRAEAIAKREITESQSSAAQTTGKTPGTGSTTTPKAGPISSPGKPSTPKSSESTEQPSSATAKPQTAAEKAAARIAAMPESPQKAIAQERYDTMYGGGEEAPRPASVPNAQAEKQSRLASNPRYPDKVIFDLSSGQKTVLDPVDESILVDHRENVQNARDIAGKRALDNSLPQNERTNAAANFEDLNSQLQIMDQATGDGRLLQSKSQSLAWHQFRTRDYSQSSMEDKLRIAKNGAALSKEEIAKIKKGTDKLSDLMAKVGAAKAGALPGKVPPGLRDLQHEMLKAKMALDDMVFHEKFRSKPFLTRAWYTGRELLAVPRALMASMDLSAVRRQGGIFFISHPIRSLAIIPDMLRAASSDKAYFSLMQDIRERPNAPLYLSSKLGLTEIKTPRLSDMEEMYLSRWADHIPLVSHSQRAYVYYLNRLRADSFDAMAKTLGRKGQVTAKQAESLSNFINVFTGRGTIPDQYANAAVILNDAFFAPRFVLSRFQVVTGQPLRYAKDPAVRKMIAGEYARALIGYGIMYGTVKIAAEALGLKIEMSFDPRSTDFGKIKIGDTRIDPLSGLSQATVLLTRLAPPITGKLKLLGHTKTASGMVQPVWGRGPLTQRKFGDVLTDFMRSKLAPLPSAIWNTAEGKKVTGEPTTLGSELLGMVTPMSVNDIYQALLAHGVPTAAALGLLAFFGDSVNTYAKRGVPPKKIKALKPR
jgi:thioredoxin reductase